MIETDFVTVYYWDHECPWVSKYCEDECRRTAFVPTDILRKYEVKEEA